jgi:hypothetical protein
MSCISVGNRLRGQRRSVRRQCQTTAALVREGHTAWMAAVELAVLPSVRPWSGQEILRRSTDERTWLNAGPIVRG